MSSINKEWTVAEILAVLGKLPRGLPVSIIWASTDDTGPHTEFKIKEYKDFVEIIIGYADET